MALKIVRATSDASETRPLRLWLQGREADALQRLADPSAGELADDAGQLVALAIQSGERHAATIGAALARWDDDVAAYRILKTTCESLIDEIAAGGAARWAPRGVALIELVRPWLDRRPAEPVLLNYLGVALFGLNEAALAVKVLQAAQHLDPNLENLAGNLQAAKVRLKRPVAITLPPRERQAVNAMRSFLKDVARRSVTAADKVSISLCMIVKDEEEMLPDCLASCAAGVDEMIIVDTGSSDRTIEIAESFGATVLHFGWNGSFSDARNHGIDRATGTHILWMDADERLEAEDATLLRALAAQPYREAHWLVETNFTGQEEVGTAANHLALRLWRHRPPYRFSGAIHEQIRVSMPIDLPERFAISTLRIRHYGYLKSRIEERNKHERNLTLLLAELERTPHNAFTHFNLGTEYVAMDDIAKAHEHLEESYRLIQREQGWQEIAYTSLLATRLIGVRRRVGDIAGADQLAAELLQVYPTFTDLVFERALAARERGDLQGAQELFERCLAMGDAPRGSPAWSAVARSWPSPPCPAWPPTRATPRPRSRAWRRASSGSPPTCRSASSWPTRCSAPRMPTPPTCCGASSRPATTPPPGGCSSAPRSTSAATPSWPRTCSAARSAATPRTRPPPSAWPRRCSRRSATPPSSTTSPSCPSARRRSSPCSARAPWPPSRPVTPPPPSRPPRCSPRAGEIRPRPPSSRSSHATPTTTRPHRRRRSPSRRPPMPCACSTRSARLEEYELFERLVPTVRASIADGRMAALTLAELFLARGFYRLAADHAIEALEVGGPEPRALSCLAKAAVAEGLFEDALPVLQATLELDPAQPAMRTLLAGVEQHLAA